MRSLASLLFASLLVASVASAQETKDAKPPKDSDMVSFKSGSDEVTAFIALPKTEEKAPGIVVIQEWWGLNDWVKDQARALASAGYVALAVDLYRGKSTSDPGEAHELMRGLPEDRALRDLDAAVAYLKSRSDVNGASIGCIGWCMGGGYSLKLAVANPGVDACVMYYGSMVTDKSKLANLHAAVLGFFGAEDRGIPVDDVKSFEETLKKFGKSVEMKIYPGTGHAFANPNNKSGYRPAAAKEAWTRTLEFFKTTLAAS